MWAGLFRRLQGYLAQKKPHPLGPDRRPMPRVVGVSQGGGRFLMGEVPLYAANSPPWGGGVARDSKSAHYQTRLCIQDPRDLFL